MKVNEKDLKVFELDLVENNCTLLDVSQWFLDCNDKCLEAKRVMIRTVELNTFQIIAEF